MIDANGLIVQSDNGDGGDSLANCASWNICEQFTDGELSSSFVAVTPCEISPGIWVRNPDPTKWYSDPRTTSRDQLIGIIVLAGLVPKWEKLGPLLDQYCRRFGFAQNYKSDDLTKTKLPDLMWFQLGLFIRAGQVWWAYPVLLITDLNLLVGAIVDCRQWRDPNDVDDRNAILQHAQAKLSMPTPVSWLARKIWIKWRPMNNGVAMVPESHPIVQAVNWYFRPASGAHEGFIPLWQKMLKQVFGID